MCFGSHSEREPNPLPPPPPAEASVNPAAGNEQPGGRQETVGPQTAQPRMSQDVLETLGNFVDDIDELRFFIETGRLDERARGIVHSLARNLQDMTQNHPNPPPPPPGRTRGGLPNPHPQTE